jgi:nuclear transport factor 2 (NTF2) superfamily protein
METKPPLPPFTRETAKTKVQIAEDDWNSRDPKRVALAYTEDSPWRNLPLPNFSVVGNKSRLY